MTTALLCRFGIRAMPVRDASCVGSHFGDAQETELSSARLNEASILVLFSTGRDRWRRVIDHGS
jgi:hypothetical protein